MSLKNGTIIALLGQIFVAALCTEAHAQRTGTICTEAHTHSPFRRNADGDLEPGPWLDTITSSRAGCTDFHSRINGTKVFEWYSSYGEIHALETRTTWQSSVEDSDIVYIVGHGNSASLAGHEFCGQRINDRAQSKRMRLGDSGRGLRILSIWSCDGLTPYPVERDAALPAPFPQSYTFEEPVGEEVWPRWQKAFSGGLKIITGSWETMIITRMQIMGNNYGQYLKDGLTIAEAWRRASLDSSSGNTPMILATGTSVNNCTNRLYNMTLSNSTDANFPKIQDASIAHSCWHAWW